MNSNKKISVLAIAAVAASLFTLAPVASYAEGMDAATAPQVKCTMQDGTTSMVNAEKDCTDKNGTVTPADQSTSTTSTTNTTSTTKRIVVGAE